MWLEIFFGGALYYLSFDFLHCCQYAFKNGSIIIFNSLVHFELSNCLAKTLLFLKKYVLVS